MTHSEIENLPRYSREATQFAPEKPGLVFLFKEDSELCECVAAFNIRRSVTSHLSPVVTGFAFVEHDDYERAEAERLRISPCQS